MHLVNKQLHQAVQDEPVIDFLSLADEPRDRYDVYLNPGEEPRHRDNNARNIFDDSNIEDRKWFTAAKKYLLDRAR
jgi:hypothetical protein